MSELSLMANLWGEDLIKNFFLPKGVELTLYKAR
jgi:hypothetical protein